MLTLNIIGVINNCGCRYLREDDNYVYAVGDSRAVLSLCKRLHANGFNPQVNPGVSERVVIRF